MRTSNGSPRATLAGTLMRASGMLRPVHAAGERHDDFRRRGVAALPSVSSATATTLLRAGEADARVDLDALERQRKLEHRHLRHRIDFREEANRAHERSRRERSGHAIRIGTASPLSASRGRSSRIALAPRRRARRGTPSTPESPAVAPSAARAGSARERERERARALQQPAPARGRGVAIRARSSQRRQIRDDVLDFRARVRIGLPAIGAARRGRDPSTL